MEQHAFLENTQSTSFTIATNMDSLNDQGDSSSSDEGRMQIDESAGRSDDDGPKNTVQPPSVYETLKGTALLALTV